MILKTGANYQAEGGYIEAGINNDIIKFKTENIDMSTPVTSSNLYSAVIDGDVKLNGASAPAVLPCIVSFSAGHLYTGNRTLQPDTTTRMTWVTGIDMLVTTLITSAGYRNPVLSSNSKKCSLLKSDTNYLISITGDNFIIDIVEGQ